MSVNYNICEATVFSTVFELGNIKNLEKRVEAASWGLEAQGLQVVGAQLGRPPGAGGQHLGGQLCRRLLHLRWNSWSTFLVEVSGHKLESLSGFLPSFFHSTRCYLWILSIYSSFQTREEYRMVFFKIRQKKGLGITWRKRLEFLLNWCPRIQSLSQGIGRIVPTLYIPNPLVLFVCNLLILASNMGI